VRGVAREQQTRPVTAEPRLGQGGRRLEQGADEVEPTHPGQLGQHPQRPAYGRERAEQCVHQGRTDRAPLVVQCHPRVTVAGVPGLQARSGPRHVSVQHRPGSVRLGIAEDGRCVAPPQTVLVQSQSLQHR
jgi:hypothetical protein